MRDPPRARERAAEAGGTKARRLRLVRERRRHRRAIRPSHPRRSRSPLLIAIIFVVFVVVVFFFFLFEEEEESRLLSATNQAHQASTMKNGGSARDWSRAGLTAAPSMRDPRNREMRGTPNHMPRVVKRNSTGAGTVSVKIAMLKLVSRRSIHDPAGQKPPLGP